MAEEFFDDEFDALFEEEGRRRVVEVVEVGAAEGGPESMRMLQATFRGISFSRTACSRV
ncbi:hypothetical protein [Kitasatospora sp. McL0602]|uniref:hypothetical protein n=1 Tax=Kitasatospora sp. McL0602 TaxID=3439530 RepID=UPI003F8BA967